jgi:hypothetical protein
MNFMISQIFVTRSFKKNKRVILSSLCLIYFVVYAISPLSYTYTVKKIVDTIRTAHETPDSGKSVNIFLLEVICAKIDTKKDVGQSNSTVTVFIRKARAILPEIINSKFASIGNLTLIEDVSSHSYNSSLGRLVSFNQQKVRWQSNPLHSGLSPPLAQSL